MKLFDKVKQMDPEEMACFIARIVVDTIYNTQETYRMETHPMSAAEIKDIIDSYKLALTSEYLGET